MEKSKTDFRFRTAMYLLISILVICYGVYKFQIVRTAFSVWDHQVVDDPHGLASK